MFHQSVGDHHECSVPTAFMKRENDLPRYFFNGLKSNRCAGGGCLFNKMMSRLVKLANPAMRITTELVILLFASAHFYAIEQYVTIQHV